MPRSVAFAFALREPHQGSDEPLANGREGELLDDADQAAQASAHRGQHLERNCGVFHAVGLEVAAGDEGDLGVFDGHGGRGVWATVEDGQLRDGFAGSVDGQHLFAAAERCLEDADLAARDDVQAVAGLALREEEFAGAGMACARCVPPVVAIPPG